MTSAITALEFRVIAVQTTPTQVLSEVNRRRRVKVESESEGKIYDQAPLRIGIAAASCIRQVDPENGEEFFLGPGQELWAVSMTGSQHNLYYTVEDSVDDNLYTDSGSGSKSTEPRGRDASPVDAAAPAPGSGRAFKTG